LESVLRNSTCGVTNEKVDRYWMRSKYNNLRWFLLSSEAAADARGLQRTVPQYPNTGSPWHPGCIERCFCPDLAKRDNESLLRLCKYTNARGMNPMGDGKYPHIKKVTRNENHYSNLRYSSSEGSMESNLGGDVVCVSRSPKGGRASPTHGINRSLRIGKLGACERNPNNYQIPRNLMKNHRNGSLSPKRYSASDEIGWQSPPHPLMRPTVQVSHKKFHSCQRYYGRNSLLMIPKLFTF
uniref:GCM domain-containing protein n=1 Tax=Rodentolepis nana TaxID=102285 RepID=A0A0R3T526_RODNA